MRRTGTSIDTSTHRLANGLSWVMLGALLLVPLTRGNALGYVGMLGALGGLFFLGDRATYRAALALPQTAMLAGAFVLLAIAIIAVSGWRRDTLVVFDFLPFLLAIPASVVLLRARIGNPAVKIAALAGGGAVIALAVAAYQYLVLRDMRPGGWELSPIHFADLAVTLGFLSLGGLLTESAPRWAALLWIGPAAGLFAAILSGTRSALLVAAGQAVLALVFFVRRYRLRIRTVLGAVAGLVVLAIVLALVAPILHLGRSFDVIGTLRQLLSDQRVSDFTAAVRLDQYQAALKAIMDAPLFGHGWRDEVESALQYMSAASQRANAVEHWGYIHNEFLSFSVGMGVFGSVAWLLLAAYPIVGLVTAPRSKEPAARNYMTLVAWSGIVISGLSDVLFSTELTKTFYCLIPGAILILCSEQPAAVPQDAPSSSPIASVGGAT